MKMINITQKMIFAFTLLFSTIANAQQWGNYTLYAAQNGTNATLIDTNGTTYHSWTFATQTAYSTYLLQGGIILRSVKKSGVSFQGGPIAGEFQKVDWDGNILWDYSYSTTTHCSHHDIEAMPNGNVIIIAYDKKTSSEVAAAGGTYNGEMWPESIIEIKQTGATTGDIVWEWHLWDHLVQNVDNTKANYSASIVNNSGLYNINYNKTKDFMHMNGIDYDPIKDQITFSSHYLDEMYIIDHSTTSLEAASHAGGNSGKGGDFIYRYGNPSVYEATGNTVIDVVHDAHFIPEGVPNSGYLVGFINKGISSSQSSVDQVDVPRNGYNYDLTLGEAYAPSTYTLRHACNGYTSNQGNSQQLPNGNMLVCMAFLGSMYEVDPQGNTIWTITPGGTLVHAYRYDECYVSNVASELPVVTAGSSTLTSTIASTYQWYYNGEQLVGETNQTYTPSVSGIYLVRTTDANGCVFYYSEGVYFEYINTSGVQELQKNVAFSVYPNPTSGMLEIYDTKLKQNNTIVKVLDSSGKVLFETENSTTIDLSSYENGLYLITISNSEGSQTKRVSLIK
ncbi:MAG: aryl-sulfate sulfotransferase [Flavobacteriia bacterium]|nr:aryl-sulfate sulfotransferase [Flavobacteriia bacterium]